MSNNEEYISIAKMERESSTSRRIIKRMIQDGEITAKKITSGRASYIKILSEDRDKIIRLKDKYWRNRYL